MSKARIKRLQRQALRRLYAADLHDLVERCPPLPELPHAGRLYSLLAVLTATRRHHLSMNDCLSRELSCQSARVFSKIRVDTSHVPPLLATPMTREERLAFRDRRRASVDAWLADGCPGLDRAIVEANAQYNTYRSQALRESAAIKDSP